MVMSGFFFSFEEPGRKMCIFESLMYPPGIFIWFCIMLQDSMLEFDGQALDPAIVSAQPMKPGQTVDLQQMGCPASELHSLSSCPYRILSPIKHWVQNAKLLCATPAARPRQAAQPLLFRHRCLYGG